MEKKKLLKIKKNFDALFESKMRDIENREALSSIKEMPFYKLKNIFENVSVKVFENPSNRPMIAEFMKTIRNSDALTTLYRINEAVTRTNLSEYVDGERFLQEMLNIYNNTDKKDLKESKDKLSKIVESCAKKCKLKSKDIKKYSNSNSELLESLNYLLNTNKTIGNLSKYLTSFSKVSKYLNESKALKEGKEIEECKETNFNSIISEDMTLWEKEALREMSLTSLANGNKEELFEKYKKECINLIKEGAEDEDDVELKSHLETMKLQLESKVYTEENYIDDILKLSELKSTLK